MVNTDKHIDIKLFEQKDFNSLISKYYNYYKAIARKSTNDISQVEDLLHDCLLHLVDKMRANKFDTSIGNFKAWSARLIRNYCIDLNRKNTSKIKKLLKYQSELTINDFIDELDDDYSEEYITKIKSLIDSLTDDQRLVIYLHYYKKLKFREIAKMQGVSINTILAKARRAIISMRRIIKENNISFE